MFGTAVWDGYTGDYSVEFERCRSADVGQVDDENDDEVDSLYPASEEVDIEV